MRASDPRVRFFRRAAAMAVLGAISHAVGAGDLRAQVTSAADSVAVVEAIERYHAGLAEGDTAAVMALLASNAVILESGGMETREEYRSHHLPADMAFARAVPRERGSIRVRVHGHTAWAASLSTARGTYREREIDSRGAELMVLHRTEDGWLIEAIHWSSRN